MALNDIVRSAIIYASDSGNQWVNVLHSRQSVADPDTFDLWEDWYFSRIREAILGPMSLNCRIAAIQLTNLSDPTQFVKTIQETNAVGLQGGTYMPTFLAACFSLYGSTNGASKRGRHYFAGLGVTLADDGNFTQESLTQFAPLGLVLNNEDPASPGTFKMGIYSTKTQMFTTSIASYLRARVSRLSRRQLKYSVV